MRKINRMKISLIGGIIIFLVAGTLAASKTVSCIKEIKKTAEFMKGYKNIQNELTNLKGML